MALSKRERLRIFQRRLRSQPRARTFDEAYGQIFRVLNEVEDKYSNIRYNPQSLGDDGRLYPPLWDNITTLGPRGREIHILRSIEHETVIGRNGSVEIRTILPRRSVFSKPGADGRKVH